MCGIVGAVTHTPVNQLLYDSLLLLQHRGQEAAGIVTFDGSRFHSERRLGLVGDTFSRKEVIDRLPGQVAVGHVRYSTTGGTILRNVQPLFSEFDTGGFAVGHNGNLTNGLTLRRELVRAGAIMQSTTDTEVILHLVARSQRNRLIDRFIDALRSLEGAYSLVALTNKKLIGARDPLGIRPLVLGELDGCPILTSETCALDIIGARYVRDVKNGEIVLNISRGATRRLTIDNEWVQFTARFSGTSQEVAVPISAIAGVFAKESGYGFAFTVPSDPVASLHAATAPIEAPDTDAATADKKPRERPKHLQVIK